MNTALLITVLVLTMALGAFPIVGTAVVANALAEDLTMSLTLFGAGVAVNTAFGAYFRTYIWPAERSTRRQVVMRSGLTVFGYRPTHLGLRSICLRIDIWPLCLSYG